MTDQGSYKYLFGPVPSRRLGWSLGVDLVPLKTCTQNCIYCQLGMNGETTLERKPYVPVDDVLAELQQKLKDGLQADYITLSGSGEPTLHSQVGELIDRIHEITSIPVAIITNGTLLSDPQGTLERELLITIDDIYQGRDFEFRSGDGLIVYRFRIYLVGHRLYRIGIAAPAEEGFPQGTERFLDSFKLIAP